MQKNLNIKVISFLVIIFLFSVAIRILNINRPLSKHHEFATGISLRIISILYEEGFNKYGFDPVMNFAGKENKFINDHASTTGGMVDAQGNYYYISHPPFAYILPLLVHKSLRVQPSVLSLQLFHLCINFISLLFIYLIICLLIESKSSEKVNTPAMIGSVVYLFNPAVLWFQCNTYMSDMLVQVFFVSTLFYLLKLIKLKDAFRTKEVGLFFANLFLMLYTSWLGFFLAVVIIFYSFFKLRKEKLFTPLIISTFLAIVFSLTLIFIQYIRIAGYEAFVAQMMNRLSERGSLNEVTGVIGGIKNLLITYVSSYQTLLLLIVYFIFSLVKQSGLSSVLKKMDKQFIIFSVAPIVMMNVLLLNYSGHDFVSLYFSVFLSGTIAMFYNFALQTGALKKGILNASVLITVLLSVGVYFYVNRPGPLSFNGDKYSDGKEIGEYIKENAEKDEVVLYSGTHEIYPEIVWYSKRNIKQVANEAEATNFMQSHQFEKAFWFHIDANGKISSEKFSPKK